MSDLEGWWTEVTGWIAPPMVYDSNGQRISGVTEQEIKEYWNSRRQHLKDNPLPVEFVNCCSGSYPIYIAAVPSSFLTASRGHPEEISLKHFTQPREQEVKALLEFCAKYLQISNEIPKWYLSSCWEE